MWGETGKGRGEVVLYLRYRLPRPTEALLKARRLAAVLLGHATAGRRGPEVPDARGRRRARDRVKQLHDNWETKDTQIVSGGIYLCDFNRDGCLDLLMTDLNGNVLYQGRPTGR